MELLLQQSYCGRKGWWRWTFAKAVPSAGLKVDMNVIPADVDAAIEAGKVNLDNRAVTLTLLQLNNNKNLILQLIHF